MTATTKQVLLGSSAIRFNHHKNKASDMFLLRLHGDEYDASDCGTWWINHYGGEFLDIINDTRECYFQSGVNLYAFDPNRIFSEDGIRQTLHEYSGDYDDDAVKMVKKFTSFITGKFKSCPCIVALHNNIDFSIRDYLGGGASVASAAAVNINQHAHPHDFIITTQASTYEQLKAQNINTVLEKLPDNQGDGSLSEFCLKNNQRYFNIETYHGHGRQQKDLLKVVARVIKGC